MKENITTIFYALFSVNLITKLYLSHRNRKNMDKHRNAVPKEFVDQICLEDHQKAASYGLTKSYFGSLSLIYQSIIFLIFLPGGLANKLYIYSIGLHTNEIIQGLSFFALLSLISTVLGLPWDLYSTFVIEEKFGFNKMSLALYIKDQLKQIVLGVLIGFPFLAIILKIMTTMGTNWWILAWALFVGFQLLMLWLYPTIIAPIFNKFSPLEDSELVEKIQILLNKTGFQSKGLFSMNASMRSSHGNAYFTGFGKNKRIVFFDTLLKQLSSQQVIAVLAHELGHFKKKHILKSMLISFSATFIGFYILGKLYVSESFYISHFTTPQFLNERGPSFLALYLFTSLLPLYTFLLTPIMTWFSRKNEFEADEFAAKNSNPQDLIDALIGMYKDNASSLTPDPLFSNFYFSHPPAKERVDFLKGFIPSMPIDRDDKVNS